MNEIAGLGPSSFERMRTMLMRAAEIRDGEQAQLFDALDEIAARLAALDGLGSIRKRLADVPDRDSLGAVAAQLERAQTTLQTVDGVVAGLPHNVDAVVDRLAAPLAQLDGRLDAVTTRFDGVAGRMGAVEERLESLAGQTRDAVNGTQRHADQLERQPEAITDAVARRVEAEVVRPVVQGVETATGRVTERVEAAEEALAARLQQVQQDAEHRMIETLQSTVHDAVATVQSSVAGVQAALAEQLTELSGAVRALDERITATERELAARIDDVTTALHRDVQEVRDTVVNQPDTATLTAQLQAMSAETARHHAATIDEAMATFAQLTFEPRPPMPVPHRAPVRATRRYRRLPDGVAGDEAV